MTHEHVEWSKLYLESIEHLLWNPSWIAATKGETKLTISQRMKRLEGLEAPLHHAFHLFASLAPKSFVAWLACLGDDTDDIVVTDCRRWQMGARNGSTPRPLFNLCQPDIFVEGLAVQAAIEIKARSKSSLEQVVKYAALMMLRKDGPIQRRLVYVAPGPNFASLWPRSAFADVDSLRAGLVHYTNTKLEKALRAYGTSIREAVQFLDCVQIEWKSVTDVQSKVTNELRRLDETTSSPSDEVYRKLLSGFEAELQRTMSRVSEAAARSASLAKDRSGAVSATSSVEDR